ncbi:MAG: formate dehydrogenase subunit gamma [Pseudomonadota bacterium]
MPQRRARIVAIMALVLSLTVAAGTLLQTSLVVGEAWGQSSVRPPANAVDNAGGSVRPPADAVTNAPMVPGAERPLEILPPTTPGGLPADPLSIQGPNSSATIWGKVRDGQTFTTSLPDPNSAFLVQDGGIGWLDWRTKGGPLQVYGGYGLLAMIGLLILFYLLRGKIRIDSGPSGQTIIRFKTIERFAHWMLAVSFIVLALSGLNLLYGKDYIMPLIGKEAFATVTMAGKWLHNNLAWAFMLSIVMVFLLWVRHNIPSTLDLKWMAKGGGLFVKGVHPPAKKFNAGQKLIFWSVVVLGGSISLSGISLLFPYEAPMFAKTFEVLNDTGIGPLVYGQPLPTTLTPIEEMMYAQLWHTIVAFAMIVIVIAHIYIGSVGMEGAFDAMGSGEVDRNWAEEHHGLWVAEEAERGRVPPKAAATPAE